MRIRHQQFLILFLTNVLLFLALSCIIYFYQKKALLNQVYSHLQSVAEAKKIRIQGIIKTCSEMAEFPSNNPQIHGELQNYFQVSNSWSLNQINATLRKYVAIIPSFDNVHIADLNGKIIASSDTSIIGKDFSLDQAFSEPRQGKKYYGGFHFNKQNELNIYLSAPVVADSRMIAVMLIDMDASQILSITSDYVGLGNTGEVTLGKRLGDSIVFLTPLRFDPNAALKQRISIHDTLVAITEAVAGREGIVHHAVDYLGNRVVSVAAYIPEADWGMVVKIHRDEALLPVEHLKKLLILFNLGGLVVSLIASFIAGNYLAKPIQEMIQSTEKIRAGDLSVRLIRIPRNELGTLAESFNHMTTRLQRKIDQLDKAAYMISHDLKAPLAAIEGLIPFLKEFEGKPLDAEGKAMMDMVIAKIHDMQQIIDNILKSARHHTKPKEQVSLFLLAREVVHALGAPSHFRIFIQPSLPVVTTDRTSMTQILQNLLSNAIKYMDKDEPLIRINCKTIPGYYQISIEDNGVGMEKDRLDKIFEMFETAHADYREDSHGIGLSIVKSLVEEAGGKIWAESEPGKGSRFHFTILR